MLRRKYKTSRLAQESSIILGFSFHTTEIGCNSKLLRIVEITCTIIPYFITKEGESKIANG